MSGDERQWHTHTHHRPLPTVAHLHSSYFSYVLSCIFLAAPMERARVLKSHQAMDSDEIRYSWCIPSDHRYHPYHSLHAYPTVFTRRFDTIVSAGMTQWLCWTLKRILIGGKFGVKPRTRLVSIPVCIWNGCQSSWLGDYHYIACMNHNSSTGNSQVYEREMTVL